MATNYSITVINNSNISGSDCVYQEDPSDGNPSIMSLAWFARFAMPGTRVKFTWATEYCFVWGETGSLMPGVTFQAAQTTSADLTSSNSITLTQTNGSYQFINQTQGTQPGMLTVVTSSSVQWGNVSTGIGMSG